MFEERGRVFMSKMTGNFHVEKMVRKFACRELKDSNIGRPEVKFLQIFEKVALKACDGGILGTSTNFFQKCRENSHVERMARKFSCRENVRFSHRTDGGEISSK